MHLDRNRRRLFLVSERFGDRLLIAAPELFAQVLKNLLRPFERSTGSEALETLDLCADRRFIPWQVLGKVANLTRHDAAEHKDDKKSQQRDGGNGKPAWDSMVLQAPNRRRA